MRVKKIFEKHRPKDTQIADVQKVDHRDEPINESLFNTSSISEQSDDIFSESKAIKVEPNLSKNSMGIAEVIIKEEPADINNGIHHDYDMLFDDGFDGQEGVDSESELSNDFNVENKQQNIEKDVKIEENLLEEKPLFSESSIDSDQPLMSLKKERKTKKASTTVRKRTSRILTNRSAKKTSLEIFECFFCNEKIVGEKPFVAHKCDVKFKTCDVGNCGMKFMRQSGFNSELKAFYNN